MNNAQKSVKTSTRNVRLDHRELVQFLNSEETLEFLAA